MRLERTPVAGGFILADAGLKPESEWFDPGYWKRQGGGQALARGRGPVVSAGPGSNWVLRHYRRGGMPGRLLADSYVWAGEARARPVRELRMLAELRSRGAPVPGPVAARVLRRGWIYRGDLLTERIADARPLAECAGGLAEREWREVGQALRRFHAAGGLHADLNARNVLLAPAGTFVVDLDRSRVVQPGARVQRRNLARLERSLRKLGLLPGVVAGWTTLLGAYRDASR